MIAVKYSTQKFELAEASSDIYYKKYKTNVNVLFVKIVTNWRRKNWRYRALHVLLVKQSLSI